MRRVSRCWSSGWRPMSKPCSVTRRDEASAMTSEAAVPFRAAHAAGGAWQPDVRRCLDAHGHVPYDANLGFVHETAAIAPARQPNLGMPAHEKSDKGRGKE